MRSRSAVANVRSRPPVRRRGFTLVELVLSMTIGSLLLGGMGAAVLIASHALPGRNTATEAILRGADVVEQMGEELHCAVTFTERTATTVEFTVADRDSNLAPETIRYAWSGTPGDPLTRQYNAGTVTNVAEGVQEFDLTYVTRTPPPPPPPPNVELPESALLVQDGGNSGDGILDQSISGTGKVSEYFLPVMDPDAVSWRITRARFIAAPKNPKNSTLSVSVQAAAVNGVPDGTKVDEVLVPESSLVADNWYDVTFANAGGLNPAAGAAIVFETPESGVAALLRLGTNSVTTPATRYYSFDVGWTEDATKDIWLWVWGAATVPGTAPPVLPSLVSVDIKLRIRTDASTRVQTVAQVLNTPEVTGP